MVTLVRTNEPSYSTWPLTATHGHNTNMTEINILSFLDGHQDILSDILSFCGGSYITSGAVSKGWNDVYKMTNKKKTTAIKNCKTIDDLWDCLNDDFIVRDRGVKTILFPKVMSLRSHSDESLNKLIRSKSNFLSFCRWTDEDLLRLADECVTYHGTEGADVGFIMKTLERIALSANEFNKKSVMFDVLEKYYGIFPHKKGCNVFTTRIAQYRFFDILHEYIGMYEYCRFNMSKISMSGNIDLISVVRDYLSN